MATRRVAPYTLSTPPKPVGESRKASGSASQVERVAPVSVMGGKMGEEDVEMHSAAGSDGWETQDSMWDEEPTQASGSSSATSISSSLDIQHRLLYRGALSVPNSAMILEGIQFIAYLPNVNPQLLSAPLPLALESMRGRPTLRLLGTTQLSPETARLDTEIDVRLHIHPQSYVTHSYFQRTLALSPSFIPERTLLRNPHPHPHIDPRATTTAVRIGLGEDVIVVYGRLQSDECGKVEKGEVGKMELVVARLVEPGACSSDSDEDYEDEEEGRNAVFAVPSKPTPRAPRPDDPLPREPPTRAILKRTGSSMPIPNGIQRTSSLKRTASIMSGAGGGASKRTLAFGRVRSEVVVRGLGDSVDTPLTKGRAKEPTSSVKGKKGKGKNRAEEKGDGEDPFVVEEVDPGAVLPKMMARVKSAGANAGGTTGEEAPNKAMIKRLAQSALETYGIMKEDEGFKTIYGYVTRGVEFAFRNKMKSEKIERDDLRKMVVRHVEMYVSGNGEVTSLA